MTSSSFSKTIASMLAIACTTLACVTPKTDVERWTEDVEEMRASPPTSDASEDAARSLDRAAPLSAGGTRAS